MNAKGTRKTKRTTAGTKARSIGFAGAGNMATALIRGLLGARLYQPEQVWASDVEPRKRAETRRRYRIGVTADNGALARDSKVVVLAVKPQTIDAVLEEMAAFVTPTKLFISIAAGVTTAHLEAGLGNDARVLRVMPNTPALLGKGMSVLVRGRYATAADERLGLRLLGAVGEAAAVQDERMLDAVTGLSGSGPAYVYRFAEGLLAGGVASGLPAPLARQLILQTLTGAAAMLQETGESPEKLRAQVTSPGGTTVAGLSELERRGFKDAVAAAVIAATRRSQELGRPKSR
jgi:pyrroline-5-carboxylate reductase